MSGQTQHVKREAAGKVKFRPAQAMAEFVIVLAALLAAGVATWHLARAAQKAAVRSAELVSSDSP